MCEWRQPTLCHANLCTPPLLQPYYACLYIYGLVLSFCICKQSTKQLLPKPFELCQLVCTLIWA